MGPPFFFGRASGGRVHLTDTRDPRHTLLRYANG